MRSIGAKLLLSIALPALVVGLVGVAVVWRETDAAVRRATRDEAVGLAEFVATSFGTVDETAPNTPPRAAHKAVTTAIRSNWSALKHVSTLRVLGADGTVRWSRRIEEEDKPFAAAARLVGMKASATTFEAPASVWPWARGGGGEVVLPLGGVACAGCHTGPSTLHTGVLQLTVDEPSLRAQVAGLFTQALALFIAFAVMLTGAMVVSLRLVLTRKLTRLTQVMRRAEEGDVLVRAPDLGGDEIGRLATAFNRMLARLTSQAATEIDTQRDLQRARVELQFKTEIESVNTRLHHRVNELQLLYDLARTIASTLDVNEVLERITARVPTALEVPKFSIMLLNASGNLEVRKAHPPNAGSEGLVFAIGEGICGRAAATGKSTYVADLDTDQLFKVRGPSQARGRGSLLSVPMMRGTELLGVLNFERTEKADFGADEIDFFTAVADQVALAVKNAQLHEQTVALSVTDPLTGVPNRRFLFAQLEAEVDRSTRYGQPLSLVLIDIDHFKQLNDRSGHQAGDDVLRQVAQLLRGLVRKVDTLARYGGEEFVVLLPRTPRAEAMEVAEKLRRAVAEMASPWAASQPLGLLSISLGVATLPGDATTQHLLVDCADAALYASKRAGRNTVSSYVPGMELHPDRERGPQVQGAAAPTTA